MRQADRRANLERIWATTAMNAREESEQDQLIGLVRSEALSIFRYHLAQTGDWQEAEALTTETFILAQDWFSSRPSIVGRCKIWLYRLSVGLHGGNFRVNSQVDESDELISPTQEQLAQFARVAEINEQWNDLPRKVRDARGLLLFAGLDPVEIADIIGWDFQTAMDVLGHFSSETQGLRLLTQNIQPVGFYLGHLERKLQERRSTRKRWLRIGSPRLWWMRYRFGRVVSLIFQLLPILLVAGLLLWAFDVFTVTPQPDLVDQNPQGAVPPGSNATQEPAQFLFTSDAALLVSADGAVYRYDIQEDSYHRLTEDRFVTPEDEWKFPPSVSPDWNTVALVNMVDLTTWLVPLNGEGPRKASDRPVNVTWSPNSDAVVFVEPEDPGVLYRFDPSTGEKSVLMRFAYSITELSWSPDGRYIGMIYIKSGEKPGMTRGYVGLLDSESQNRVVLFSDEMPTEALALPHVHRLLWTEDGSEIWLPAWKVSLRIDDLALADRTVTEDTLPQGAYTPLPLEPLVSQPYSNRYGIQEILMTGAENQYEPVAEQRVAVSPDRKRVALVMRNPNGWLGSIAVQESPDFWTNRWIQNLVHIGKVSWAIEGQNLLVGENENAPGRLFRMDAFSGRYRELKNNYRLLGTVSELGLMSLKRAPQARKIPLNGPDLGGPVSRFEHPGLGIRFNIPSHWRTFVNAPSDPNGSMMITNFDFSDPLGFTSLSKDDIVIRISRISLNNLSLPDWLEEWRNNSEGKMTYEEMLIAGNWGYEVSLERMGSYPSKFVYFDAEQGPIAVSFDPPESRLAPEFTRLVRSMIFSTPVASDSAPELSSYAAVDWVNYQNEDIGISFDLPRLLMEDGKCSLRMDQDSIRVGGQILLRVNPLNGNSLDDYSSLLVTGNGMQVSRKEKGELNGRESLSVEGSLSTVGLFHFTLIRDGSNVVLISFSPSDSCIPLDAGFSEWMVYRQMVNTIRIGN